MQMNKLPTMITMKFHMPIFLNTKVSRRVHEEFSNVVDGLSFTKMVWLLLVFGYCWDSIDMTGDGGLEKESLL